MQGACFVAKWQLLLARLYYRVNFIGFLVAFGHGQVIPFPFVFSLYAKLTLAIAVYLLNRVAAI